MAELDELLKSKAKLLLLTEKQLLAATRERDRGGAWLRLAQLVSRDWPAPGELCLDHRQPAAPGRQSKSH